MRYRSFAIGLLGLIAAASLPAWDRPGRTEIVGVRPDGTSTPSSTITPAISGDGLLIGFQSYAPDLVAGDTNARIDFFIRDMIRGVTSRISVATDGTQAIGDLEYPTQFNTPIVLALSGNGRFAVFQSGAANLVPDDTNAARDIFLRDLVAGSTERVSLDNSGSQLGGGALEAEVSADGRFVVFQSEGLFLRDRLLATTERIDVSSSGQPSNFFSYGAKISDDGRFAAFQSSASNLGRIDSSEAIYASGAAIFLRDRQTGVTERISGPSLEVKGNGYSWMPDISGDGRFVAYSSEATDLIPGDLNNAIDVFVYDRLEGTTTRVSVNDGGAESVGGDVYDVAISGDGRFVSYTSLAPNLVAGDTNLAADVFLYDRLLGLTERVSVADSGAEANAAATTSAYSAIGDSGDFVAFQSDATNLVPGATNVFHNIYRRNRGPAVGVRELTAAYSGSLLDVSGVALFAGTVVSSASDPLLPAPSAPVPGGDVGSAEFIVRPENEDVLLRLRVPGLPGVHSSLADNSAPGRLLCFFVACPPSVPLEGAVTYRIDFAVAGVPYRVVVAQAGAVLQRCDLAACTPVEPVTASVGSTGQEVVITFPLRLLAAPSDAAVTAIRVVSSVANPITGAPTDLDFLDLPAGILAVPSVRLGLSVAGTPEAGVTTTVAAVRTNAAFTGTIDTTALPCGAYDLWARACLGSTCGARQFPQAVTKRCPPVARLVALPSTGIVPHTVVLSGATSSGAVLYEFDFGDGSAIVTQAADAVTHVYTSAGIWTARLRVKDAQDLWSDAATAVIEVTQVTITAIDPLPECAGRDFELNLRGLGFEALSVVQINGANRVTVYDSASQLRVGVLAGDTVSGSFTVRVTNPSGGLSNVITATLPADATSPVVTPPSPIAIFQTACSASSGIANGGSSPALAAFLAGGSAADQCTTSPVRLPAQIAVRDVDDSTPFPAGTTTVTFRYRDAVGNVGSATSAVSVQLSGDLNLDASVDATDLVIIANVLVGNMPYTGAAGDVTGDGRMNAVDAVVVANYLAGNISCLVR